MSVSNWTDADSAKAQEIWADYQQQHDLSSRTGQTAGIDPASGRIWFVANQSNTSSRNEMLVAATHPCFSNALARRPTIERVGTGDQHDSYSQLHYKANPPLDQSKHYLNSDHSRPF